MLIEPTHCGLWITWRGIQCEVALGLVHPEETTLQTVPIHEDCVVVEVITVYTIFADELLEFPPNDEVMKLGQAQGQRLQWRRFRIDIKRAPICISHSQAMVHKSSIFHPHLLLLLLLLLLLNPHTFHPNIRKVHKIFHPHLLLVLKNRKTCIPTSAGDTKYSIPTTSFSFSSS
jgi:hypothetical protein